VREGALVPYLISGFTVALPIIALCIILDSMYFGQLTITSLNFLRANVFEGLSKYYGVEPLHQYVLVYFPLFFTAILPLVFIGFYTYYKQAREHG